MHDGAAASTDSHLCLNSNLIWSGAERSMGRREEPCPSEKKIKLKRESTNRYAGRMWHKGLPSNPADWLGGLGTAFWINMKKAQAVKPDSSTWQLGHCFLRLKVTIYFCRKWVTGATSIERWPWGRGLQNGGHDGEPGGLIFEPLTMRKTLRGWNTSKWGQLWASAWQRHRASQISPLTSPTTASNTLGGICLT